MNERVQRVWTNVIYHTEERRMNESDSARTAAGRRWPAGFFIARAPALIATIVSEANGNQ